jgi:hypothetical protein
LVELENSSYETAAQIDKQDAVLRRLEIGEAPEEKLTPREAGREKN